MFSWSRGSNVLALFVSPCFHYLCLSNFYSIVTQADDPSSGPDQWDVLFDSGSDGFQQIYFHNRPQVARAVEAAGGSYADGTVFYRVAFIHAALATQEGHAPENATVAEYLKTLAVLHFRDWRTERKVSDEPVSADTLIQPIDDLPTSEVMRPLRHAIWARRQFFRLSSDYRYRIQELADDAAQKPESRRIRTEAEAVSEGYGESLAAYKNLLKDYWDIWEVPFPRWVVMALNDSLFIRAWDQTQVYEQQLATAGEQPPTNVNHFWRNAFIVLGILTVLVVAVQWFMRPKTPKEVYSDNFSAPQSLLDDLSARQANSPDNDSIGIRTEACQLAFADADAAYRSKEYRAAAAALAEVLDDSNKTCHSDAYFYLAIIGLHLDEPGLTLECLSSIEDLSRYGEDLYWYQALAYVKMATKNPMMQDKAVRAVNRVISNTEIPERREQAEKMLRQLNN